jgi:LAS superfamily LD-carboxypeptidase LdcB
VWSAPPGASRHHWGSDLDVYDRAALPPGQRLQLVPAEYAETGPFAVLTAWLNANMHRFGFYRPYTTDRGGVQPEPWHLSHIASAREVSKRLRLTTLRRALENSDLEGRAALLANLPVVYSRFIRSVDRPPR